MKKYTMFILAFILITGPGLIVSVNAELCDRTIEPCRFGSCMPCNLEIMEPEEQNDCSYKNGCPKKTEVYNKPRSVAEYVMHKLAFQQPTSRCLLCFWKMN